MSSGSFHTCEVDSSGAVQCWGYNSSSQSSPPSGTFVQVSAGSYHSCGIDSSGSVQCWGVIHRIKVLHQVISNLGMVHNNVLFDCCRINLNSSGTIQYRGYDRIGQVSNVPSCSAALGLMLMNEIVMVDRLF